MFMQFAALSSSFTARQLCHINSEGAHRALSHHYACTENLKWILDKQLEILSTASDRKLGGAWERG